MLLAIGAFVVLLSRPRKHKCFRGRLDNDPIEQDEITDMLPGDGKGEKRNKHQMLRSGTGTFVIVSATYHTYNLLQ